MEDKNFKQVWFVLLRTSNWEYVAHLRQSCWVIKSDLRITPDRETQEQANRDFANLGYAIKPHSTIQYEKFKKGTYLLEIMVQCHTEILTQ